MWCGLEAESQTSFPCIDPPFYFPLPFASKSKAKPPQAPSPSPSPRSVPKKPTYMLHFRKRVTHLHRLVNKHYIQSTRHVPKKIEVIGREVDYYSVSCETHWRVRMMGFFPLFSSLDSSKVGLGPTTPHFFWSRTACRLQTWDNNWNGEKCKRFFLGVQYLKFSGYRVWTVEWLMTGIM